MLGIAFGFEEESAMDRFNNRALARFVWPTDESARAAETVLQSAASVNASSIGYAISSRRTSRESGFFTR